MSVHTHPITLRGFELSRDGSGFYVKEQRLLYDLENKHYYNEMYPHSQLYIFTGLSKDDAINLVRTWLSFFDDIELMRHGLVSVNDLYDQVKELPPPIVVNDDDKDMN